MQQAQPLHSSTGLSRPNAAELSASRFSSRLDTDESWIPELAGNLADVFEGFYVDLEGSRQQRGFDPVAALNRVQDRTGLRHVFAQLNDRHTLLALPRSSSTAWRHGETNPHSNTTPASIVRPDQVRPEQLARAASHAVLELPIRCEKTTDCGRQRFWIADVRAEAPPSLRPGVQVTHWNGMPIATAANEQGARLRANHAEARLALGLRGLTQRLLGTSALPLEDWVTLTCRESDGREFDQRLDWSDQTEVPSIASSPDRGSEWREPLTQESSGDGYRCGVIDRKRTGMASTQAVYLRLFSIPNWDSLDRLTSWLEKLYSQQTGLPMVLDLRSNAGGEVETAERLARLLAGSNSETAPQVHFQFRDTPMARTLLERNGQWRKWGQPWTATSPNAAPHSKEPEYLKPHPLSPQAELGALHPLPVGPIVVLADASTFSAAELLIALLKTTRRSVPNNSPSLVIAGIDAYTGCGPDNAFHYETLRRLHLDANQELASCGSASKPHASLPVLPLGVDFQLTVRRALLRFGDQYVPAEAGPVEVVLPITRDDLLHGNRDLLSRAVELVAAASSEFV